MYEFEQEWLNFKENFKFHTDKKIVLYGIGRKTATLVEYNNIFDIVGLMDRDSKNIGKIMYGLPVLSLREAEEKADFIVINAPEVYWETIYNRISNSIIPIYYLNGKKAQKKQSQAKKDLNYWDRSLGDLKEQLSQFDIISFDIFDTLISRKVLEPTDVFPLINEELHKEGVIPQLDYSEIRNRAMMECEDGIYTLEELYQKIGENEKLNQEVLNKIRDTELSIEKQMIVPRYEMIQLCSELLQTGRDVYLVSDMYFSAEVIKEMLAQCGLNISKEKIWISCEKKAAKKTGKLWEEFFNEIVRNKRAIHIGDNIKSDIEMPQKYGITTFYVMRTTDMLRASSMSELYSFVTNAYESLLLGSVIAKQFGNPFVINKTRGEVIFEDAQQWGFFLWGMVINAFFLWMSQIYEKYNVDKLYFLSRDGYLMEKDYLYWKTLNHKLTCPDAEYLYTSRRCAYMVSCKDRETFEEWRDFPYKGLWKDYLKVRFSLDIGVEDKSNEEIEMPKDREKVIEWLSIYKDQIESNIEKESQNYRKYISEKIGKDSGALVDIGFYGLIQSKLQGLVDRQLCGFYFANYLAEDNKFARNTKLIPCFQEIDDPCAKKSFSRKYSQLLESIFTAPYGMVIAVDEKGECVCLPSKKNQEEFLVREEINEGIQEYLSEIRSWNQLLQQEISNHCLFINRIVGSILQNTELTTGISSKLYFEEEIVKSVEQPIT